MSRFLALVVAVATATGLGCGMLPGMGGSGGSFKPAECYNTQFGGDLSSAKEGQYVTYATEAGGSKTSQTVKIVGKEGGDWLVEQWMDMGSMAYGMLFQIGGDKKIKKAWAAAKGDKEWTSITVKETPASPTTEGEKPEIKESSEKKEVKAGTFDCKRIDVKGKNYAATTWFSKDAPKIYIGGENGGAVAMEAAGSKTSLEAKGDDAKPTIELPKK